MIKLNCSDFLDTGIYLLFKVMTSKNNLDTFRYLNIKKDTTNHRFLLLKNNAVVQFKIYILVVNFIIVKIDPNVNGYKFSLTIF